MAGRLDGRVALITGTGGGQGRAAAGLFCAEGAAVVGCDLNADGNAHTVERVKAAGGEMTGMAPVDLGDSRQARQWVADAAAIYGRIDILFNNAAAPRFAPIAALSDDGWHYTVRNELDLIFYATQAAWPHLLANHGGVIVNTASVQGLVGIAMNGGLAHAAAKGGVIAMTRQIAAEGAPHGIRANSISPGTVATGATTGVFADEELLNAVLTPLLIKRLGQPTDIVPLAVYLASDESAYVTGANFTVDGGLSAT
jgi:meso-butanediol dehydrogenase/(S,S)-butanediol dehydrogenase/diacetyl reductase